MPAGVRFRLFLNVMLVVVALILAKTAAHRFHLEFLPMDTLFPSVVAGTIFIVGFLLTGMLPDYKEAERIPGRIRVSLEALHAHGISFAKQMPAFNAVEFTARLRNIVLALKPASVPRDITAIWKPPSPKRISSIPSSKISIASACRATCWCACSANWTR